MPSQQLTPKDPAEIIPVKFDFAALLSTITSVSSVSVSLKTGVDPNVATMKQGTEEISGTSVIQLIKNGVSGATYIVRCEVISGSEKYALAAILPVESA